MIRNLICQGEFILRFDGSVNLWGSKSRKFCLPIISPTCPHRVPTSCGRRASVVPPLCSRRVPVVPSAKAASRPSKAVASHPQHSQLSQPAAGQAWPPIPASQLPGQPASHADSAAVQAAPTQTGSAGSPAAQAV